MKIYIKDQQEKLKVHLDYLKEKEIMSYNKAKLTEKTTTIDLKTTKRIEQLNLEFLFAYKIFPDNILTFLTQWKDENREMRIGDTIAQQVYIPPIKKFSQKIIFGVRINEIIDQATIKGFSYETLDGHVEKGISTFTVEQVNDSRLIFKIHTYSTPGHVLTRLLKPVFSVPYQTFCTNAALVNVKKEIEIQ